ncbi:hypothetical protein [uncultured Agrococcus sp.]|uniref:hypothetical protein n=1 Tax=uncultured Agrococcus sp. TaxID=382258 RepID=UPI0025F5D17F|nr:hypothetical protein [uncultured Agrococcus sp.]
MTKTHAGREESPAAGVTTLRFRQEAIGVFPEGMHGAVGRGWQDKLQRIHEYLRLSAERGEKLA